MKNIAKHSIKCNKRDKLEDVLVEYLVFQDGNMRGTFITKYEAFSFASTLRGEVSVYKSVYSKVLS
ncbi:MAG: hypothetical protein MJZ97_09040 [Bacteroidales bacterium]|nr:hypothetical protein [Bacteroidales bacterium]